MAKKRTRYPSLIGPSRAKKRVAKGKELETLEKGMNNEMQWPNSGQAPTGGTGSPQSHAATSSVPVTFLPGANFGREIPRRRLSQYKTIGDQGLEIFGGYVTEEFRQELQGLRGTHVYEEMRKNDAVVGAMLFVARQLIQNASLLIKPNPKATSTTKAQEWADFVEECIYDMDRSWPDVLDEILTMLDFGYSYCNVVHKKRRGYHLDLEKNSRYDDNKTGWSKIALRAQMSFNRWVTTPTGNILGFEQNAPPTYTLTTIPVSNAAHFRTQAERNNPEGKALDFDTPIATVDGWKTMGTIKVGDKLFDAEGKICYVTAKLVWEDRPCYELSFGDGESIIADENHEWYTQDNKERNYTKSSPKLRSTKEIAETIKAEYAETTNHSIAMAPPLDYPKQELLLHPYYLGLWLGDGCKNNSNITSHAKDVEELADYIEECGYTTKIVVNGRKDENGRLLKVYGDKRWDSTGPAAKLRVLGLKGNKHIPRSYLRSSIQDRLQLLMGLMDSDGYVDGDGRCEFTNTNFNLADGVAELVRSLGIRVRITSKINKTGSTSYLVKFTPTWSPFKLRRKTTKTIAKRARNKHYLISARKVDNRPTVCIEVSSPTHQFLVGKSLIPTHNSILRNAWRPWVLKKHIEETEVIAVERDVTGIPVLTAPEGMDLWNENDAAAAATLERAENIVRLVRLDKYHGIVLPFGWNFSLQTTPGQRAHNTSDIISRWDQRIAITLLADMLLIGHERVGSFAMVQAKTKLFSSALESYAARIAGEFNTRLIPRLMTLNNVPLEYWPIMKFGPVETPALTDLAEYMKAMYDVGINVDEVMAEYFRQVASFPPAKEGDKLLAPKPGEPGGPPLPQVGVPGAPGEEKVGNKPPGKDNETKEHESKDSGDTEKPAPGGNDGK